MNNNQVQKTSITIAEIMYLLYFAIMLEAKAIGLYEGQVLYNICLVCGALFFILKMIVTKFSAIECVLVSALLALGLVVYLRSGEKSLLIFLTMMTGMKDVSESRVFKIGAILWGATFVSVYVLSVIGVIPEIAYTIDRNGWPPILRHALGYPHPNSLHVTYLILTVLVLYALKELSKNYLTAVAITLMLGNCYVFMYSLSRNGFLATTIFILLELYFVRREKRSKIENFLIKLVFPISALVMVIVPLMVHGALFEKLNLIFAGRFIYTKYFLTYEPLQLFGIREIPVPSESYIIDSSYVYLLFRLGIVAYVLYFITMLFFIDDLVKKDKKAELAVVLALTIGGISETFLFNQSYKNLIFIMLGSWSFTKLSKLCSNSKSLWAKEFFGFTIGRKVLNISRHMNKHNRRTPINIWLFSAFIFVTVGIITSILYMCIVPTPKNIYLPDYEITKGQAEEVYLTQDDVKELRREGDIIRGYVDSNTPLYRMYRKGTAKVEYLRYIFSYGLWAGSVVTIAFLSVWIGRDKVRHILRNKKIGAEYKENVLIVHNYYRIPGGEDIVVANEKALLERNGHKVVLYSRNNTQAGDHSFLQKVALAFVSIFNLKTYRDVCMLIDKEHIDIIQVHNTVALISPAVYLAGINRGIPVIQTVHNFRLVCPNGVCYIRDHVCERCLDHGLKASLLYNCYRNSKLQTFVCALSIKIQRVLLTYKSIYYICLTEFNKEKISSVKQISTENIYIKPNFTTLDTEPIPFENRKNQLVYAGRIEKIKGLELLLQAWMKLGEKAPKLIICGSGELDEWCSEYIQNNDISSVEMKGQVSNAEVKRIVGESLAMVYPTQWYEGFPMAVAEAYTMGTPIIAADIGNVGNLVEEGVTGLKFKSNSVVALARAVEKFMENPIILPRDYCTKYTAENNYKILKHIYEDVRSRNL